MSVHPPTPPKLSKPSKAGAWLAPEKLAQLKAWAQDGLTIKEIAARISVSDSTLYAWCRKHPPIADALGYTNFTAGTAYRVILGYSPKNGTGFICATYTTPEEAWQDPRVQSRFKDFHIAPDYEEFARTVEHGKLWQKPWAIGGITVLRCRITKAGYIVACEL